MLLFLVACDGVPAASVDIGTPQDPEDLDEVDGGPDPDEVLFTGAVLEMGLELTGPAIEGLATTSEQVVEDVHATLLWKRERYDVGLHLKGGGGSFQPITGKPAFKIDVGQWDPDARLHGYKHLTLNNMVQDPSMLAEHGAYRLHEARGLAAPRHAWVRLTINGQPFGLYSLVETLDEDFVDRAFDGPDGPMYEGSTDLVAGTEALFPVDVGDTDGAELTALIAALDAASPDTLLDTLGAWFDVDALLDVWAVELVTGNPDGYVTRANNYALYWDPTAARFTMIPWGVDLAFAANLDVTRSYIARMYTACVASSACAERLRVHIAGVVDTWEEEGFSAWMEAEAARIEPDCLADPRSPGGELACTEGQAAVLNFVAERPATVRTQLEFD